MRRHHFSAGTLTMVMAGIAVVALTLLFGVGVSAQTTSFSIEDIGSSIGLGTADLRQTVINILQWSLGILALVAVSFIIYGGFLWTTAAGRQERIDKAKKVILRAVIGLVIVLISWAIVLFVGRFITGGGGGGGVTCTPNEVHANGCFVCNGSGTGYVPIVPTPPGCIPTNAEFTLTEVDTAHGGTYSYEDVYLCSSVQARFNQRVKADSVLNDPNVKITRKTDRVAVIGAWSVASNSIVFKQQSHCQNNPSQTCTSDNECGGSTCGKLLEPSTTYTAHFPRSIQNTSDDLLEACTASGGCALNNGVYEWDFTTGTDTDSTAPTVTSTYPVNSGAGYPDRNVSRQPVLEATFSEAIDMTSVVDSANSPHPINGRIIIEQLDGQSGSVVSTIDPNIVSVSAKSLGFRFSLDAPNALEPFTWYRITVQGVEDLCGNGIAAPVTWEFQTNDAVAGVKSVYPTGTNQCPDTKVMFTFGTTMWDNTVQLTIAGGATTRVINLPRPSSMTAPYEFTNSAGTLRILDTNTQPVDNNFRVFEFRPSASFADNTTYTATIDTDLIVNSSGGTLSHQWQFAVSDASKCSCKPYVARFSPDQGPRGMCVSIIGTCFAGTKNHPATVSDLQYDKDFTAVPGSVTGTIGGQSPTVVTSFIPPDDFTDGDQVYSRVEITYTDPAFGKQADVSADYFFVNSINKADGPCLFSLTPDSGDQGTNVTAKGIRFGPDDQTTAEIHFENGSGGANAGWTDWKDTTIQSTIQTTVPNFAVDGDVDVHNDKGVSNPIFFDVTFPPPSSPVVMGHWPTCNKACLNAGMGAQFNLEMDAATISPASIEVRQCTSASCDNFDQDVSIGPVSYFYDPVTRRSQADWGATNPFAANRWYRVEMLATIAAPDGGTISNLNYDNNNDGTDDSFSWIFQTGDIDCRIDRLETLPLTHTFTALGARRNFMSTAYGQPDSCSAEGQIINPSSVTWSWTTSDSSRVTVGGDTDHNTDATSVTETVPNPPVNICAAVPSQSVQDCSQVVVDLAHCTETTDCTDRDGDGTAQCNGSTCDDVTRRCTPLITALSPAQGPVGQWATVGGCFFGSYRSNRCSGGNNAPSCLTDGDCGNGGTCVGSRIVFSDQKQGVLPAICGPAGSTWSDTSIVTEVPNIETPDVTTDDAVTGPIAVIRGSDNVTATSAGPFTVRSGAPGPGICYAQPNRGPEQTLVSLIGKNFGTQNPGDKVVFYKDVDGTLYDSWTDTKVVVRVPNGAVTNNVQTHPWFPSEIAILKGTLWSNVVNFTVETNTCAVSCSTDAECVANVGPGRGCSATGCCAPSPSVLSSVPAADATGVCRNSMVEVNFDMPMAGNTLNANNVILSYVITAKTKVVAPKSVTRDTDSIRLTYGLLDSSTRYTVTVKQAVTNTEGVHLAADRSWTFWTLPDTATNSGVCQLSTVWVAPAAVTLTGAGQTQDLQAQGYDATMNPLTPIPGVYDWSWSWASTVPTVATVSGSTTDSSVTTAVANGKTLVSAIATGTAGWTGTKIGLASVEVDFCVNPWLFVDTTICSIGVCPEDLHMTTRYCLDTTSGPSLPDLDTTPVRGRTVPSSTLMKQYLFKDPDTEDGIGIRVFENPTLLSIRDWYAQQVPNPGRATALSVDGYPALRDGTSVYVSMANLDQDRDALLGRIVLLSYNEGASDEVVNIFNQLLKNFRFNENVSGDCANTTPSILNKECIARDLGRLNDLQQIAVLLDNYRAEVSSSSPTNLITNAGFENANAADNIPTGWSFGQRDGSAKHAGNFSVRLDQSQYSYQDIPVQFGKSYIVSGWIKTDLDAATYPNGKALIESACLDSGHTVYGGTDCSLNHTNGTGLKGKRNWSRQSFVIEADTSGYPFVRISCVNGPTGNTGGSIWCDDITVVEGTSLYPDLTAGSFISGMSVSRWPQSWNTTLGNQLKTSLPTDPLNTFASCPAGYDQTACWNETTTTFFCDPESHVYAYTTDSGANYRLYGNLEYEDTGNWKTAVDGDDICSDGRSSCRCFDYDIASP